MEVQVRKIGSLSADEIEALSNAGQILGSVKKAFESGDITELDETAIGLFGALKDVIEKVSK